MISRENIMLKAEVLKAIRSFMDNEGFVEELYQGITPATGSCESIANIFILKDSDRFLTLRQTAQLFLEESIVTAKLPRMWTMGRSFRRDKGGDGRHLQDFTLLEWEALDTDLEWLLECNVELVQYVTQHVLQVSSKYGLLTPEQHSTLYKHWRDGVSTISYDEAIEFLRAKEVKNDEGKLFDWGDDLSSEAERHLTDKHGMVQVVRYPEAIKFFNMKNTTYEPVEDLTVECVDLLLPKAGETIGGSQREDNYDALVSKLDSSIMLEQLTVLKDDHDGKGSEARQAFNEYLALFEPASIVRSGAGMGLGRLLQFIKNSDEIIPF